MTRRLTECPKCGSKSYTAVEKPSAHNRKYICRRCGSKFGQLDARRKAQGWTESEIAIGINRRLLREFGATR